MTPAKKKIEIFTYTIYTFIYTNTILICKFCAVTEVYRIWYILQKRGFLAFFLYRCSDIQIFLWCVVSSGDYISDIPISPFKSLTPYIPQTTLNKNKKNYIQFIDSNENKINSLLLHFYNVTDKKTLQSQKNLKQTNI